MKRPQISHKLQLHESLPARGAWVETTRYRMTGSFRAGRSPQGERGLKPYAVNARIRFDGRRSPQGERGLKRDSFSQARRRAESLPARGAWVETPSPTRDGATGSSLPARGAWVETEDGGLSVGVLPSRSPQGERGLKREALVHRRRRESRSPQGERGLKPCCSRAPYRRLCRSPQGERGLKHDLAGGGRARAGSLPARGAWVETARRGYGSAT